MCLKVEGKISNGTDILKLCHTCKETSQISCILCRNSRVTLRSWRQVSALQVALVESALVVKDHCVACKMNMGMKASYALQLAAGAPMFEVSLHNLAAHAHTHTQARTHARTYPVTNPF